MAELNCLRALQDTLTRAKQFTEAKVKLRGGKPTSFVFEEQQPPLLPPLRKKPVEQ